MKRREPRRPGFEGRSDGALGPGGRFAARAAHAAAIGLAALLLSATPAFCQTATSPNGSPLSQPTNGLTPPSGVVIPQAPVPGTPPPPTPGSITTVVGFGSGLGFSDSANLYRPGALVVDQDNNLYISDPPRHLIYIIDPWKVVLTEAGSGLPGFAGDGGDVSTMLLNSPHGLAVDPAGGLLIADTGNQRVRRADLGSGNVTTVMGGGMIDPNKGGTALTVNLPQPTAVAADPTGNVYVYDDTLGRIYRMAPSGTVVPYAGTGTPGYSGDNGPAAQAAINHPTSLAVDGAGHLLIADTGNARIRLVGSDGKITTLVGGGSSSTDGTAGASFLLSSPRGLYVAPDRLLFTDGNRAYQLGSDGKVTALAGTGQPGYAGENGPALNAKLYHPFGIGITEYGEVMIADQDNGRLRFVDKMGNISLVSGGQIQDTGPATVAAVLAPQSLAFLPDGEMLIADTGDRAVRIVRADGTITTFCGDQDIVPVAGVAPTACGLSAPAGVAVDATGNVYVSDAGNNLVWQIGKDGLTHLVAGSLTGTSVLSHPQGLSAGPHGDLYVADTGNNVVRRVDPQGKLSVFAGTGTSAYTGDAGLATDAGLKAPAAVEALADGSVLIADSGNNVIRRVGADGVIRTIVGTGQPGFAGDAGPATQARLTNPLGLATAPDGTLFVSDTGGQRVRKIDAKGIITTVVGNGTLGPNGDGGPATQASLFSPAGLALDTSGNLFIADRDNDRIREVASVLTNVAPAALAGDVDGDGKLTLADALLTLKIAVGLMPGTAAQRQAADVAPKPGTNGRPYGDGQVNALDVLRLIRRLVGLIPASNWP